MRPLLGAIGAIAIFVGVFVGGLLAFGNSDSKPQTASMPAAAEVPAATSVAAPSPSTKPRRATRTRKVASASTWIRAANAECVRSARETKALEPQLTKPPTYDDLVAVAEREAANERRTITAIAALERQHPRRVLARQLTRVGRDYLESLDHVMALLHDHDVMGVLMVASDGETLRNRWGTVAATLGAKRCGAADPGTLAGVALDSISP